ncbi:MAG: hypothetical protein QF879_13205, partial [Candidatus Latescibacteria bacterium]|nr:hypothetical protein [Candidatus Latescibacterota bacterium]
KVSGCHDKEIIKSHPNELIRFRNYLVKRCTTRATPSAAWARTGQQLANMGSGQGLEKKNNVLTVTSHRS